MLFDFFIEVRYKINFSFKYNNERKDFDLNNQLQKNENKTS